MRMVDLIEYKKNNGEFNHQQIQFIIDGYVEGSIPDYQISKRHGYLFSEFNIVKENSLANKSYGRKWDIIDLSKIEEG